MEKVQLSTEINVALLKEMLEFQKEIMSKLMESLSSGTGTTPDSPIKEQVIDLWV